MVNDFSQLSAESEEAKFAQVDFEEFPMSDYGKFLFNLGVNLLVNAEKVGPANSGN